MIFKVNIIALFLGMFINMGLGALWYSNVLFAKSWMKEAGITEEDINDPNAEMGKVYGMTALTALITSYAVGFLVVNIQPSSLGNALIIAVIVWLGMDLSSIIKNWGFEKRTIKLGLINHGYDLVVYMLLVLIYTLLN